MLTSGSDMVTHFEIPVPRAHASSDGRRRLCLNLNYPGAQPYVSVALDRGPTVLLTQMDRAGVSAWTVEISLPAGAYECRYLGEDGGDLADAVIAKWQECPTRSEKMDRVAAESNWLQVMS